MMWMLLLACGDKAEEEEGAWSGGDYAVYTLSAEDACFDGALSALFMPEGPETPHPFEYLVYLPGFGELPTSYTVDLRAPFLSMPITVTRDGADTMQGSGEIEGVLLNEDAYGDCTATMAVSLSFSPTTADTATGSAVIDMRDISGDDGRCPVPAADPCPITLELWAEAP